VGALGAPIRRREDPRLLTGHGTYVDDLAPRGTCHAAFVRSPHGRAEIRGLDTATARKAPGVLAVYTAADLDEKIRPIPLIRKPPGAESLPPVPALAHDRVYYQGEPVAVVVADSRAAASDAAALVSVAYEPLPAVTDIEQALEDGAPRVHAAFPQNVIFQTRLAGGDAARAFAQPDIVRVKQRMRSNRLIPFALEPRVGLADYDPFRQRLTFWLTTQRPHHTRWFISQIFADLPEHQVRVVAPDVGGAFGSKEPMYPDEVALLFCAITLGRPVKWVEGRRENFLATTHGRDQVADLEVAATRDGRITAIRGAVYGNMGGYLYPNSSGMVIGRTGPLLPGAYAIPNVELDIYGVFTNTTPLGPYRGAGRPEAIYYVERLVDLVAHELGLDPAEVRRRNLVRREAFPYHTATSLTYDSGDYQAALDRALELVDYDQLRRQQAEAWRQGRYLGVGLACYVELGGATPSRLAKLEGSPGLWESATVRVHPTGKVTVAVGTAGHGQGHETAFAQIAAEALGLRPRDVEVLFGDTETAPFGFGTFGTRSMTVGGAALRLACDRVVEKGKRVAAQLLEAAVEDVAFAGGRFVVRGAPGRGASFPEVARAATMGFSLADAAEPGLDAEATFDPPNYTFSSGTHVCVVEVEPDTGRATIRRYVAVDDCGRAINPLIVEGQMQGGIAQGIGQALLEHARYDDSGQLITGSLLDYAVPTAAQVPNCDTELVETPSPSNPLGVKGIGEGGAIAAPPAVANAVLDALRPLGIRHLDLPLTPERVWRAMLDCAPGKAGGGS
jgi:aerobic carbon-monoxide dehydrogenase large subunit